MKDDGMLQTNFMDRVIFCQTKQLFQKNSKVFQNFPVYFFYLLASSLTLSISAINDTSLSTMLQKEKKRKKKKLFNSY